MTEVKIVRFSRRFGVTPTGKPDLYDNTSHAEQEMAELIDDGWEIEAAGGYGGDMGDGGFVVLVKETDE